MHLLFYFLFFNVLVSGNVSKGEQRRREGGAEIQRIKGI